MHRWKGLVAAVAAASVVLAGGTGVSTAATRAKVRMRDNFFAPGVRTIEKGTRVRWVNRGANPHTTTSNKGLWDSGTLMPGESFARKFRKKGSFRYHCEIHDGMTGKIVVVA